MKSINHRDLEQCIGGRRNCDDYLKLKVSAYYSTNNKIVIATRRGEDRFFIDARGPKSDLSDAVVLSGRYLVIGDIDRSENVIFTKCALTPGETWTQAPDDLYLTRLLIAGAARIVTSSDYLTKAISATPEYKQAVTENRVIVICE